MRIKTRGKKSRDTVPLKEDMEASRYSTLPLSAFAFPPLTHQQSINRLLAPSHPHTLCQRVGKSDAGNKRVGKRNVGCRVLEKEIQRSREEEKEI